mgnify:CR=1 FL=1
MIRWQRASEVVLLALLPMAMMIALVPLAIASIFDRDPDCLHNGRLP